MLSFVWSCYSAVFKGNPGFFFLPKVYIIILMKMWPLKRKKTEQHRMNNYNFILNYLIFGGGCNCFEFLGNKDFKMFPFKWELITAWSNLLVLLPELSKRRMIWVKVQFRKWSWHFSSAVIHFLFLSQDCKWQNCIDSQRYHWLPAHFDIIIFETFNDKKLG